MATKYGGETMGYIEEICKIREKNNGNWIQLLKIALESDPERTKPVLKAIIKNDEAVTKAVKGLLRGK